MNYPTGPKVEGSDTLPGDPPPTLLWSSPPGPQTRHGGVFGGETPGVSNRSGHPTCVSRKGSRVSPSPSAVEWSLILWSFFAVREGSGDFGPSSGVCRSGSSTFEDCPTTPGSFVPERACSPEERGGPGRDPRLPDRAWTETGGRGLLRGSADPATPKVRTLQSTRVSRCRPLGPRPPRCPPGTGGIWTPETRPCQSVPLPPSQTPLGPAPPSGRRPT